MNNGIKYFEVGCLCILNGELPPPPSDSSDDEILEYYEDNCTCSRNYKHLERK